MLTLYKNIKERRLELGLTQTELANKLGYADKSMIAKVESGIIDLSQSKIIAFANALSVSPPCLMGWEDDSSLPYPTLTTQTLPILATVSCGKPTFSEELYEFQTDVKVKADFIVIAKGDSMINARIFDGDKVFVRSQPIVENGEIAVVRVNGETVMKRFYRYAELRQIRLVAENPLYPPLVYEGEEADDITILGKAVILQAELT